MGVVKKIVVKQVERVDTHHRVPQLPPGGEVLPISIVVDVDLTILATWPEEEENSGSFEILAAGELGENELKELVLPLPCAPKTSTCFLLASRSCSPALLFCVTHGLAPADSSDSCVFDRVYRTLLAGIYPPHLP